jgi:phage terminase small subunit
MPREKLLPKQMLFIRYYLRTRNATQAAIKAGYSKKGADVAGSRLLGNASFRAKVEKALAKYCEKIELSPGQVLKELADHAYYDPRNLFDDKGNMIDVKDLDDRTASAIAGIEHVNLYEGEGDQKHVFGQLRKVKLTDRLRALELLGKHLKLFPTTVDTNVSIDINVSLGDRLDAARKRLAVDVTPGPALPDGEETPEK